MVLQDSVRLKGHITHDSGKRKTVCVTACLTALGVPVDGFSVTGTLGSTNYLNILNRHGFSTRSRKSKMPKSLTMGKCRKAVAKLNEDALYLVILWDGKRTGYCHAIVVNNQGKTVVDTDPRKRDQRKVHSIHAITKMQ